MTSHGRDRRRKQKYCISKFCSDPLIKCAISEYHALIHLHTVEEQVTRMWYADCSLLKMVLQVSKHCELKFKIVNHKISRACQSAFLIIGKLNNKFSLSGLRLVLVECRRLGCCFCPCSLAGC